MEREEMIKIAEEYVTMGRLMARGYAAEMEKIAGIATLALAASKMGKGVSSAIKNTTQAGSTMGRVKQMASRILPPMQGGALPPSARANNPFKIKSGGTGAVV